MAVPFLKKRRSKTAADPPVKKQPTVSVYASIDVPYLSALGTYFGYAVLYVFGHLCDFLDKYVYRRAQLVAVEMDMRPSSANKKTPESAEDEAERERLLREQKQAPLMDDFQDFYTRRLYKRIRDCWGRPIASPAGAWIDLLMDKDPKPVGGSTGQTLATSSWTTSKQPAGEPSSPRTKRRSPSQSGTIKEVQHTRRVLNVGSYNYLGFGEVEGGVDASVFDSVDKFGVATCDSAVNTGTSEVMVELERTVARFIGKQDAMVMGMGFATNSQLLPAIVGPNDLIVSDSLNHASIVVGARSTSAKIVLFQHNDIKSLRDTLRSSIANGNPRKDGAPWERILIVIEGMYSMEGESPPLREIVKIKKEFGVYLFVDEAHSVGALGATGRGVCEHYGVDPKDVDILMGTFTKSFGAVGGYVASSRAMIEQIRAHSPGTLYSSTMSPPCARHIIWTLRQIAGLDGTDIGERRIKALRENSIFFRKELAKLQVQTLGDWDSPVIPIMLYNPAKIAAFSRECLERGLAVVVVGFPATPLLLSRARICLSAAHTREDLVMALRVIDEVAELIQIKYNRSLLERFLPEALYNAIVGRSGTRSSAAGKLGGSDSDSDLDSDDGQVLIRA